MTITIAGIDFDHHRYDKHGDVLYLNVGAPRPAARSLEVDGGHTIHYDESDCIVGLTLLNIKHTLDTNGFVELTLPVVYLVDVDELPKVAALLAPLRAVPREDELFPMAELPDDWKTGDDGSPAPNWVAALRHSRGEH